MPRRFFFVSLLAALTLPSPAFAQGASPSLDSLSRLQPFQARRESSANPDLAKNGDARSIAPGETLTLGELEGPGVVAHLWFTVGSDDPFYGRNLVLRIYWDGAEKPSVESPFGEFFGVGHGALADYSSAPASTSSHGRAVNCYWRMPFRKRAKLTVTNESSQHKTDSLYFYVDWQKHESLPDDIAYFHARYRQAAPPDSGDYVILETQGRGHYVGTVYSAHQLENGWFGEGDDRFYIDGEAEPSLRGTGTEDYFGDAWGFRPFARPSYGVSLFEGYFAGDRLTAYRWHLDDPIPFTKSLKLSMEHRGSVFNELGMQLGTFVERYDWLSSVAFWYQSPPATFDEPIAPADRRLPPYHFLSAKELEPRAEPPAVLNKSDDAIMYMPRKPDASLEFDFEAWEKGSYRIDAILMHGFIGSRYQPLLDGKPVGPELDFCEEGMDPVWTRLDTHKLEKGKHTIRFEGRGASPNMRAAAIPAYAISLRGLTLLRLEEMPGFREAMKRAPKR